MSGLILAAVRRRRLQGVMGNHPRCLARVAAISKTLDPMDVDGENVGIAKCGRAGAAAPRRSAPRGREPRIPVD